LLSKAGAGPIAARDVESRLDTYPAEAVGSSPMTQALPKQLQGIIRTASWHYTGQKSWLDSTLKDVKSHFAKAPEKWDYFLKKDIPQTITGVRNWLTKGRK